MEEAFLSETLMYTYQRTCEPSKKNLQWFKRSNLFYIVINLMLNVLPVGIGVNDKCTYAGTVCEL